MAFIILAAVLVACPLAAALPQTPMGAYLLGACVLIAASIMVASLRGQEPSKRKADEKDSKDLVPVLVASAMVWALIAPVFHLLWPEPSLAFAGPMLHAWIYLGVCMSLFLGARYVVQLGRFALFALLFAIVAGGTIVSVIALQEFAIDYRAGYVERVFATSTPDILAGYLVLTAPLTAAAAASIPRFNVLRILLVLATLIQLAAIRCTFSLAPLVSLSVAAIVFVIGWLRARRAAGGSIRSLIVVGVLAVIGAIVMFVRDRTLLPDMRASLASIASFTGWTWRSSIGMIGHNILVGTGIGTYPFVFQRYAPAMSADAPHSSYLEVLGESGIIQFGLLAAIVALCIGAAWRALVDTTPSEDDAPQESRRPIARMRSAVSKLPPQSTALVAAGLLASLAGAAVQNLFSADLRIFAIGATFWATAGLSAGLAQSQKRAAPVDFVGRLIGSASLAAAAVFSIASAIGAGFEVRAIDLLEHPTADAPQTVPQIYTEAEAWDPLEGRYPAEYAYHVLLIREGRAMDALPIMRKAVDLEPTAGNYRRLGSTLVESGDNAGAIEAYKAGLRLSPNSLVLLEALAGNSSPQDALAYDKQISDLAPSGVTSVHVYGIPAESAFASATIALAAEAASRRDFPTAVGYYKRAFDILENYAATRGSDNPIRIQTNGGHRDLMADRSMHEMYMNVAGALTALDPKGVSDRATRIVIDQSAFDIIIGDDSYGFGDIAAARASFQNALPRLLSLPLTATSHEADEADALSSQAQQKLAALQGQ